MGNYAKLWVPDFLSKNKEIIQSRLGVKIKEPFGFGWFGGVYATDDPRLVVKITHDPSEDIISKYILKMREEGHELEGFTNFYQSYLWPERVSIYGRDWLVNITVRDNINPVEIPGIPHNFWDKYRNLNNAYAFQTPSRQKARQILINKLFDSAIDDVPALSCIYQSINDFARQWGFYIHDLHDGNTGEWKNSEGKKCYVLYDLGNTPIPYIVHREFGYVKEQGIANFANKVREGITNKINQIKYRGITTEFIDDNDEGINDIFSSLVEISYPLLFPNEVPSYPLTKSSLALMRYYIDLLKGVGPYIKDWEEINDIEDGQDMIFAFNEFIKANGGTPPTFVVRKDTRHLKEEKWNFFIQILEEIGNTLTDLSKGKDIMQKVAEKTIAAQTPLVILAAYAYQSYNDYMR